MEGASGLMQPERKASSCLPSPSAFGRTWGPSGSLGQSPAPPPPLPPPAGNTNLSWGWGEREREKERSAPVARNPSPSRLSATQELPKALAAGCFTLASSYQPQVLLHLPRAAWPRPRSAFPRDHRAALFCLQGTRAGTARSPWTWRPAIASFCHGCWWQLCPWKTSRLGFAAAFSPLRPAVGFKGRPLLNIFYFQEYGCYFRSLFLC